MKFMKLEDLKDAEYTAWDCEMAYRRGVHQAYAILRQALEAGVDDPMAVLALFEKHAAALRDDRKAHPLLLHEIWDLALA